jgi:tRNA(His) guanylyltransferase
MANSEYEYVKRGFEFHRRLPASNWIVLRIDGCHFHRYSSSLPPKRVMQN